MSYKLHNTVYLALGSNLGNPTDNLRIAENYISQRIGLIEKKSSDYLTKPWGFKADTDFVNNCLKITTRLSPIQLLYEIKKIEKEMGKIYNSSIDGYHSRIIDIDIIFFSNYIYRTKDLHIPHPLYQERLFVLEPLQEILD